MAYGFAASSGGGAPLGVFWNHAAFDPGTVFLAPFGEPTAASNFYRVPAAGVVDLLCIGTTDNSTLLGFQTTVVLNLNGVDQTGIVIMTGVQSFQQDTTHRVTVAAGDVLRFKLTSSINTSPFTVAAAARFTPS